MADINNTTTTNNTSSDTNVIVYICIHLIMPCAVVIGIIGNLLSILVFARREMIKFCVSIFTIVLALSDILLLSTSLFNIILPNFLGGSLSDKSAFWCHFHGYFDLLFAALSGYSVVFISVERWFSVWKPFDKAKYVTFKTTIITVVSYTSISIIAFSWFPLILHYNPNSGERCQLQQQTAYKILGTISVIFTYIVPFIFLGILNILIVYRLHARRHTSLQRSMTSASSSTNTDPALGTASTRKRQRQKNTDRNITFMLIAVAIAFMVMSFPFQIYWFYMQIRQLTKPNETLFTLTQTFRYLNCCCNFFLYSATSSLFRRELREIFQCPNSPTNNRKGPTTLQAAEITRTRIPSSPALYSTHVDNSKAERKKLLTTSTTTTTPSPSIVTTKVNLAVTSTEPNNGHTVSIRT